MSENKVVYSRWLKRGTNTFIPTDNSDILDEVEAGVYDLRVADGIGFYMLKRELHLDDIIEFPSSIHTDVLNEIKSFWNKRSKFKEYGFAFKRGILLHGRAGSGKSCTISLCMKYVINQLNGVIMPLSTPNDLRLYSEAIPEIFRVIEKDRPIIIVLEDIEGLCQYEDSETLLLNVLDGLDQLENVVYIATTNYIEKLKERIINRPNRFDRRIYVPFLNYEDRLFFFKNKILPNDLSKINVEKWAKDTKGMSVAHLAELIKSIFIFESDYEETIKLLKEMQDFKNLNSYDYEKEKSKIGFQGERTVSDVLEKPISENRKSYY